MADIALLCGGDMVGILACGGGAVMTVGTDARSGHATVIETGIGPVQG